MEFIPLLAGALFTFWFFLYLPADMANNRNRSAVGWVILNMIFPFFALILLNIVGEAE
jgi:short subunit fatty acids transporter